MTPKQLVEHVCHVTKLSPEDARAMIRIILVENLPDCPTHKSFNAMCHYCGWLVHKTADIYRDYGEGIYEFPLFERKGDEV